MGESNRRLLTQRSAPLRGVSTLGCHDTPSGLSIINERGQIAHAQRTSPRTRCANAALPSVQLRCALAPRWAVMTRLFGYSSRHRRLMFHLESIFTPHKDIMLDFLGDLKRTHMCGELRASDAGSKVVLMGWVNKRRDLGNLIFLDLRDRSGLRRWSSPPTPAPQCMTKATAVRSEFVLAVIGHVKLRDAGTINKNIPDRRDRSRRRRDAPAQRLQAAALHARRHRAGQRRSAPEVSLCRPAPRRRCSATFSCGTRSPSPSANT